MEETNEILEKIIDERGFGRVIADISDICLAKAEHLRTNWQDEVQAEYWEDMSRRLDKVH